MSGHTIIMTSTHILRMFSVSIVKIYYNDTVRRRIIISGAAAMECGGSVQYIMRLGTIDSPTRAFPRPKRFTCKTIFFSLQNEANNVLFSTMTM